jgi:hypothetical protein
VLDLSIDERGRHVVVIVVITEGGEEPSGAVRPRALPRRFNVAAVAPGDVIAAEDDEIGGRPSSG